MEAGPDAAHPSCLKRSLSARILTQDAEFKVEKPPTETLACTARARIPRHQHLARAIATPHGYHAVRSFVGGLVLRVRAWGQRITGKYALYSAAARR